MPYDSFDRSAIHFAPLSEREDRAFIEKDHVPRDATPAPLADAQRVVVDEIVSRLVSARAEGRSRMLVFGAHTIKNGLASVLIDLMERGWVTHLATNGAGIIHDWEFAYQGHSSEHVAANVAEGRFGTWHETGTWLNLALLLGAYRGMGYGEAVGAFVEEEQLSIPTDDELRAEIARGESPSAIAAAAELLEGLARADVERGVVKVAHPFKSYGVQAAAYRMNIPFTGHPMFGHDIIYTHPLNHGASIGRGAERDFLTFAQGVSQLEGGVYLSIGSAVMSPMIFEKSLSMSQNVAIQKDTRIENHYMAVVDLQESHWDWSKGEPPSDNPDYYLRFNKSFSRMGGTLRYLSLDNRDFLLAISRSLMNKES